MPYVKIKPRRGTKAQWEQYNPTLAEGELAIEVPDTGVGTGAVKMKIGNGTSNWAALPYALDLSSYTPGTGTVAGVTNIGLFVDRNKWVFVEGEQIYTNTMTVEGITTDCYPQFTLIPSNGVSPSNEELLTFNNIDDLVTGAGIITLRSRKLPGNSIAILVKDDLGTGDNVIGNYAEMVSRLEAANIKADNLALGTKYFSDGGGISGWIIACVWNIVGFDEEEFAIMYASRSGLVNPVWTRLQTNFIDRKYCENGITVSFDFKVDDIDALDTKCLCALQTFKTKTQRLGLVEPLITTTSIFTLDKPLQSGVWIHAVGRFPAYNCVSCSTAGYTSADVTMLNVSLVIPKNGAVSFKKCKVESGNIVTDWVPSSLDKKLIKTRKYFDIIATAADFASGTFYFGTVVPDNWSSVWRVKYRLVASSGTDVNYNGESICESFGAQATRLNASAFNNHYNGSYRSFYYHVLYSATSAGYTAGYGHALGVGLRNSANPTNASYKRKFTIEILETENCTVNMFDTMKLFSAIPGTGATNYSGYWEWDASNNGLRESGDDNSIDRLMMSGDRYYAGAKGIYGSQICMQVANGQWESLTQVYTTATGKAKNTSGFLLTSMFCYSSGTTITSGNLTGDNTAYVALQSFDFRYSCNCASTLVQYKSVYLVGTITNGLFYLADVWYTQTLPTTNNGYVYMYVGEARGTTNVSLYPYHPMYKHNGTALLPYFG